MIGNDVTVSFSAEAGQLQLNAFEPIIAYSIYKSISHLRAGCLVLAERCMSGVTANLDQLNKNVAGSIGLVTAVNPFIGYVNSTEVAREALVTGESVLEIVLRRGLLTRVQLEQIMRPETLTRPGVALLTA